MKHEREIKLILAFYAISALVFLFFGDQITRIDEQIFLQINQIRNTWLDYFFIAITVGGSTIFWSLLIVLFWLGKKKKTAYCLLATFLIDSITLFETKLLFNRPRPGETYSNLKILDLEIGKSFPSAHSERAFSGATIISLFHRNLRPVLYILSALVAISRIFVGVHYPLDVIYGSVNGILIGYLVMNLPMEKIKKKIRKLF